MKKIPMNKLLETAVDGYTFQKEWSAKGDMGPRGLLLDIAMFFGLIGPGLFMVSHLVGFNNGMMLGFLTFLIGYGLPHLFFLGRAERFIGAMLRPQSSWISRGFVFANAFIIFGFLSVAPLLPIIGGSIPDLGPAIRDNAPPLAFLSALLVVVYPGFLFSTLRAISFWNSKLLIPLFVILSFEGGLALTMILVQATGVTAIDVGPLAEYETGIILGVMALVGVYLWREYSFGSASRASVVFLTSGRFSRIFDGGVIVVGLVLPFLIGLYATQAPLSPTIIGLAGLLEIVGIFLLKYSIVHAGIYKPLLTVVPTGRG